MYACVFVFLFLLLALNDVYVCEYQNAHVIVLQIKCLNGGVIFSQKKKKWLSNDYHSLAIARNHVFKNIIFKEVLCACNIKFITRFNLNVC